MLLRAFAPWCLSVETGQRPIFDVRFSHAESGPPLAGAEAPF